MYRFLLLFLIPFISCQQDPPLIIDLRPQVSSFEWKYVELRAMVDTIDDYMGLRNAICKSVRPNSSVFIRIGRKEDVLLDSNTTKKQFLISMGYLTYDICNQLIMPCYRKGRMLNLHIGDDDSLYSWNGEMTLSKSLFLYYYQPQKLKFITNPSDNYLIALNLDIKDQGDISIIIEAIKKISNAYIEVKDKSQKPIPPLKLLLV